ncbi:hypothetical protein RhiJN_24600 [Ceratobasidium sp. AG-Ba]|nr:hypothetical protein RhiJN_24600 [Ceratobasidium sp. AG-Ba]
MILPSLTIVSNVLKVLFFAALTREDLSSCLTIATIDFSIRGAHFASYVGLSRAGLPLPVGLFVPPPRPVTDTDLALYITPVAAVTVDALSVLLKPAHRVATLHYPQLHSANRSLSVGPPPSVDVELFYALLSSHATTAHSLADIPSSESSPNGSRAPLSAAISLGQCTPYRVLPTRGDDVLEMDIGLDEPAIEVKVDDYATKLLDRLEGSEEVTKEFLFYQAPPCTGDSCAMVVYVKRSEVVFKPYVPICVVLALWCYVWFVVVAVLSLIYWLVPLVSRILLATLGFVHRLLNAMLIVLVMFAVNVCVRLYINMLFGTNRDSRDVKHALPIDIPSPAALPSLDRTPIATLTPDLESPPMEPIDLTETAPLEEEPASSVDTVEEGPVSLVGPSSEAVDTPAINPASVPLPEDSEEEGEEVTPPPSVQAPSLPTVEPSQGLGEEDPEEGEWTTVVKKKPWRPFVPAPNAGASSNSRGGGRRNGRGRGKGKGEGGSKGKGKGKGKEGGKA